MTTSLFQLPFLASGNGRFVPPADLRVSFADTAFMMGTTVSEQLRTFGGELFLPREHLQRLARSLDLVGTRLHVGPEELAGDAQALVTHNHQLLRDAGYGHWDLGLGIFVTAGTDPSWRTGPTEGPLVGMVTYPLDFPRWAAQYETGARLVTAEVRQTAPEHWPLALKCRSRMHYFRAAQQVGRTNPGAVALLLNQDGSISETPTANVLFVSDSAELVSPERDRILPGISLEYVERLAAEFGWRVEFRAVQPHEIEQFAEVWLTSTPYCALPVVQVDQGLVGDGQPGPRFRQLISRWGTRVGCEIPAQARLCAATARTQS